MNTTIKNLVYFIVSVIAVMILIFATFKLTISFDSIKLIVLCFAGICLLTILFLFYAAFKNSKDIPFPFGLTSGSIRGLIAVLILMFFICLSLIFYFDSDPKEKFEFAKNILTTLGTLVIAVSAFYFGSKATEQGSKIASDAFDKAAKNRQGNDGVEDVPESIIQMALSTDDNKTKWMDKYKCDDIVVGKKQTQGTTNNVNCLVFKVKSKDTPQNAESIPATISFVSNGKTYNIPTDVQSLTTQSDTTVDDTAQQPPTIANDGEQELPVDIDVDKKSEDSE